jgi:hypothetical protein
MGGSSPGQENLTRPTYGPRTVAALCDWICSICGCMNFARRTSCFQVFLGLIWELHFPLENELISLGKMEIPWENGVPKLALMDIIFHITFPLPRATHPI